MCLGQYHLKQASVSEFSRNEKKGESSCYVLRPHIIEPTPTGILSRNTLADQHHDNHYDDHHQIINLMMTIIITRIHMVVKHHNYHHFFCNSLINKLRQELFMFLLLEN